MFLQRDITTDDIFRRNPPGIGEARPGKINIEILAVGATILAIRWILPKPVSTQLMIGRSDPAIPAAEFWLKVEQKKYNTI